MEAVQFRFGRGVVVIVALALVGACSTSGAPDSAEPTVASTTIASTVPSDPSDVARADAAVLTIDDLARLTASEWSSRPRAEEVDDPDEDAILDEIAEGEPARQPVRAAAEEQGVPIFDVELGVDAPVRGESPTFVTGLNESGVEHSVSVYPTGDEAAAAFSATATSGYLECAASIIGDAMQAEFDRDDSGVVVADTSTSVEEPDLGDDAIRMRATLLLEAPGQPDIILYSGD